MQLMDKYVRCYGNWSMRIIDLVSLDIVILHLQVTMFKIGGYETYSVISAEHILCRLVVISINPT